MYIPPFKYTDKIVNLIADISRQIEQFASTTNDADKLRLRKANRIKTIHSSLAIEGNNLTEGQVKDIINGKNVIAPIKEIQEVNFIMSLSSSILSPMAMAVWGACGSHCFLASTIRFSNICQ